MVNFYLFIIMSILLIILPGPDNAIVTKNTLTVGKTGGYQTMLGSCIGLLIHTFAAVVGLSAIIVKSALLFAIFKYVGAIYLVYIGIKTIFALKNKSVAVTTEDKYQHKSCFQQGFLTNILNPKVAVFFFTFLPQFVVSGNDTFLPFLLMGVTYSFLTTIWFLFYIYLINEISTFMKKPKTQTFVEGITGSVLIVFGIKLALEKAHQ